jgi:hypothetical protein
MLDNYLFINNKFEPSDPNKFLSLIEFNIKESDIVWITKDVPKLE